VKPFALGIASCIAALFLCAQPVGAETLTRSERDQAMSYLHATRKQVLDVLTPLGDEQLNYKPAPERWSVAECAEHLAEIEPMLRGLVQHSVNKVPVDDTKRETRRAGRAEAAKQLQERMADRSVKAKAPEQGQPKGRYATKAALIAAFRERRDETIRYVETTNDDLRGRVLKAGPDTERDLYEYILMIAAHTERHLLQMREVMASPGFPK
jgi:uncharacterized damage-inducible protein DinB